jgi:hypothetical protein
MTEGRVALFKAELSEQWREVDRLHTRIKEGLRDFKETQEKVDSMGYKLHNLYCAYEELFEIVARYFENQIEPERYHSSLLKRMKLDIPGVRPALLSRETYLLLDELRRFRHFFRHAYGVDLDPDKVEGVAKKAVELKDKFEQDLGSFLSVLGSDKG